MALVVNTNVASLNAQRNLTRSQGTLSRSMQRLSSGLRINSAKDDAAGLGISDRMTSQIRGLNQAARNANDAISLGESTNMLQRMRDLAIQSANDTNSVADRASLDAEYQALATEIDRIASATTFNSTPILDGTAGLITYQVGANSGADQVITIDLSTTDGTIASLFAASGAAAGDVSDQANSNTAIGAIDLAIQEVDSIRGELGAIQSRLESTISNLTNVAENLSASRSRILDADIALETAEMTKANILQQAGVAVLSQANQTPALALSLLQG